MGYLHLCSRSLVFDSDAIGNPLIKIRYNNHFEVEQYNGEQLSQIVNSVNPS